MTPLGLEFVSSEAVHSFPASARTSQYLSRAPSAHGWESRYRVRWGCRSPGVCFLLFTHPWLFEKQAWDSGAIGRTQVLRLAQTGWERCWDQQTSLIQPRNLSRSLTEGP